jgi:SAM-dependent MidA family methyltransferase
MQKSFELPAPPPEAIEHSRRLTEMIRAQITDAGGWITFSRFMELALYAPGLGYYSAGARKFGEAGDFVTAPEVSSLFSICLARASAEVLRERPGSCVMEIGAGSGAMAADMLADFARQAVLPERYLILETSADLRERQYRHLSAECPQHLHRIEWLDGWPDTPINGVILANEVLDALPVDRFIVGDDGISLYGVANSPSGFEWAPGPVSESLLTDISAITRTVDEPWSPGYISEICPSLSAWIGSLADALNEGVVFLADYGLPRREIYHPDRRQGTLMCHYRHRAHDDPFLYPGLQDITAWVDFTAVADSADAAGLHIAGYTTQAQFLIGTGIERFAELETADVRSRVQIAGQLRTLMMPSEMGERFKVMTLEKGSQENLPAVFGRDLRHLL